MPFPISHSKFQCVAKNRKRRKIVTRLGQCNNYFERTMSCMRESSIFADYVAALCTYCPSGDKKAGEGIAKWGRTMPSHGETRCAMPPTCWGERWVRMDNSSAGTMHKHGRRMRARDCSKVVTRCCAMRTQNGESRPNSNALGCEWLDLSKISNRQT